MKHYPKIEYYNQGIYGSNVIAFDKLDGSNIRCEWSRQKGWYKFGTRGVMIDKNNEDFGKTIPLFLEKYGDSIPKVFTDKFKQTHKKFDSFVVFCEYVGENSFAGWHDINDKMDIVLFDVNQYKKGFISPWDFLDKFGHLDVPKIIYEGKYTDELINNVKTNRYNLKEGVIAKGLFKTKNSKEEIWMVKIKTNEWLRKIKTKLGDKALLEELNNDTTLLNID